MWACRLLATLFALLFAALLAGCAIQPAAPVVVDHLFDDAAFAPTQQHIDASTLLSLSPPMLAYLRENIVPATRWQNARAALIGALYTRSQLQLRYDAELTRTPIEAFEARAGNCLSLVLMTAAFAREMGLPLRFQSVPIDEEWSREGDLLTFVGHVNIALGGSTERLRLGAVQEDWLTVDFLPGVNLRHQRSWPIDEARVLSMYMNNKAAESLAQRRVDEAYWWAREAVLQDPSFGLALNTLGVVYLRHGQPARAETALRQALLDDADNPHPLNNLVLALTQQGRDADARVAAQRVQQLLTSTPYGHFELGQQALRRDELALARQHFEKALRQGGDHHEFHFALARVLAQQGEIAAAQRELELARQHSGTTGLKALYAGKLQRLREQLVH